ncbi:MAG: hypothetical protein HY904_15955 [Deltaproteobacteria bacterium]|nr:hypothetical protein [Deltaproteobacteria bacterium]
MNQPPPKDPKGPAAPAPAPAAGKDKLETSGRNIFTRGRNFDFNPTPVKKPGAVTGEQSSPALRVPVRIGATGGSGGSPRAPAAPQATTRAGAAEPAFTMPGAPAGGAPPDQKKPINLQAGSSAVAARAPAPSPKSSAPGGPGKPAAPAAPGGGKAAAAKPPPPKPQGLITDGDKLAYQGKLPVYVGKPEDGNPMIDAEDATFVFDPKGQRVQLQCRVASIMLKAACLHLGIPPPDRGPKKFVFTANLKAEEVRKHMAQLFDGNLEVRLGANENGRPVLLDLTAYESYQVTPAAT